MRFVEYRVPSALDQIRRVRAIPAQRTDTRIVRHLTADEQRALLDAPEPSTRLGIRDRAMLLLALAGGLRVSELVGVGLDEVQFTGRYVDVRVRGKGRRERALTLWKSVGARSAPGSPCAVKRPPRSCSSMPGANP
jgi:site-specific recombinase XerD